MAQKHVLIISDSLDLHARAVAYAVRAKGHVCDVLYCQDFPTTSTISLRPFQQRGGRTYTISGMHEASSVVGDGFDAIWLRRIVSPWLPEEMHPGDRDIATRQGERFLKDVVVALDSPRTFWVNHFDREIASLKVHQLRQAELAGLTIPDTLVSNDPREIKEFIARCGGVAAHKVLELASWKASSADYYACYTSAVTEQALPRDSTLQLCPGIFQSLLPKHFEVRVTCFGDRLLSLRIDSQSDERARVDWRQGQWFVEMRPYELPESVAGPVRDLMRRLRLAAASLDFVVTPDGEHVFLEANPQGQFLWMEDRAELPVLDEFAEYLLTGDSGAQRAPASNRGPVSYAEFQDAWKGGLNEDLQKHVRSQRSRAARENA